MARIQYMPMVQGQKSQAVDALNAWNERTSRSELLDKRLASDDNQFNLRMERLDRRDMLADKRDNNRIALAAKIRSENIAYRDKKDREAKQSEVDSIQGLIDASTIGFNPETTSIEDVADYSKTVDEYDTDVINKTLAGQNLVYGEIDKELTPEEKKIVQDNEGLANIKDDIARRRKELEFANNNSQTGTKEDDIIDKASKAAWRGTRAVGEGVIDYITNPIADIFRDENEEIDADEANVLRRANVDERLRTKNPLSDYRTRVKELKALQETNKNIRDKNKANNDLVEKVLNMNKTKVYDGTSTKQENVMLNRREYNQASNKELANSIKKVLEKKSSVAYKKAALLKLTGDKKTADNIYATDIKEEMALISKRIERAEKLSDQKEVARLKAKLSYLGKKKIATFNANSAETIANIKNKNANTKRTENQTRNNK